MDESASYIDSVDRTNAPDASAGAERPRLIRLRGLVVAAGAWAVLAAGACLTPCPSGNGTHEQLGLPPCAFLQQTGWPCPSCGMTTSVSAMMRGRFVLAVKAHPFGALLAGALAVGGLAGAVEAVSARDTLRLLHPGVWWAWAAVIGVPVGWGLKILIGLADGTLPVR